MTTALSRLTPRAMLLAAAALAATFASVSAPTAAAASRGGVYVASLSTPLAAPRREILDGAVWNCSGAQCSARIEGARPVMACGRVAKKFGEVARFTTPGGDLVAEDVARCNAMK